MNEVLVRLLGPGERELGCDECFDELDRYVELELAGASSRTGSYPGWRHTCAAARPARRSTRACATSSPQNRSTGRMPR